MMERSPGPGTDVKWVTGGLSDLRAERRLADMRRGDGRPDRVMPTTISVMPTTIMIAYPPGLTSGRKTSGCLRGGGLRWPRRHPGRGEATATMVMVIRVRAAVSTAEPGRR